MKPAFRIVVLCALVLFAAACERETVAGDAASIPASAATADSHGATKTPMAPTAVATTNADATGNDVVAETDDGAANRDLDAKTIAGRFSGMLQCADCDGVATTLILDADGRYILRETRTGAGEPIVTSTGTWTTEDAGKHLRLDPGNRAAGDRVLGVSSPNALQMLDKDGNAPTGDGNRTLKRIGAGG